MFVDRASERVEPGLAFVAQSSRVRRKSLERSAARHNHLHHPGRRLHQTVHPQGQAYQQRIETGSHVAGVVYPKSRHVFVVDYVCLLMMGRNFQPKIFPIK